MHGGARSRISFRHSGKALASTQSGLRRFTSRFGSYVTSSAGPHGGAQLIREMKEDPSGFVDNRRILGRAARHLERALATPVTHRAPPARIAHRTARASRTGSPPAERRRAAEAVEDDDALSVGPNLQPRGCAPRCHPPNPCAFRYVRSGPRARRQQALSASADPCADRSQGVLAPNCEHRLNSTVRDVNCW